MEYGVGLLIRGFPPGSENFHGNGGQCVLIISHHQRSPSLQDMAEDTHHRYPIYRTTAEVQRDLSNGL